MAWWDRNRRQPAAPPQPQHFDLGAIHAQRERDRVQAAASAAASIPAPVHQLVAASTRPHDDPLVRLLERPLPVKLPPLELVAEHDPDLTELMTSAAAVDGIARSLAEEYLKHLPGGTAFRRDLDDATTPEAIEWLLTKEPAKRWAAAWLAQRAATRVDEELRTAAANSDGLREWLTEQAADLADEIVELCQQAIDTKRRRHLEDAEELAVRWRELLALREWTAAPRYPYTVMPDNVVPKVALVAWTDALIALGEEVTILSEGTLIDNVPVGGFAPIGTLTDGRI